jgi:hypothetical protein
MQAVICCHHCRLSDGVSSPRPRQVLHAQAPAERARALLADPQAGHEPAGVLYGGSILIDGCSSTFFTHELSTPPLIHQQQLQQEQKQASRGRSRGVIFNRAPTRRGSR